MTSVIRSKGAPGRRLASPPQRYSAPLDDRSHHAADTSTDSTGEEDDRQDKNRVGHGQFSPAISFTAFAFEVSVSHLMAPRRSARTSASVTPELGRSIVIDTML